MRERWGWRGWRGGESKWRQWCGRGWRNCWRVGGRLVTHFDRKGGQSTHPSGTGREFRFQTHLDRCGTAHSSAQQRRQGLVWLPRGRRVYGGERLAGRIGERDGRRIGEACMRDVGRVAALEPQQPRHVAVDTVRHAEVERGAHRPRVPRAHAQRHPFDGPAGR
eukprot:5078425-Prymnesium_polylepis.3